MASNYNDSGNAGCRIGNWVEEQALEKATGMARYNRDNPRGTDTFARLMGGQRQRNSEDFQSVTRSTFTEKYIRHDISQGPREIATSKRFYKLAEEETKQELENKSNEDNAHHFRTEAGDCFVPLPFDASAKRYPRASGKAKSSVPRTKVNMADIPDEPITFHSQQLILGNVTASTTNSTNPFSKNTLFSTTHEDGIRSHEEDSIAKAYDHPLNTKVKAYAITQTTEAVIADVVREAQEDVRKAGGVTVDMFPQKSTLRSSEIWDVLAKLRLKMSARRQRALVEYLNNWSPEDIVSKLSAAPVPADAPGAGDQSMFVPRDPMLRVWYVDKHLEKQEATIPYNSDKVSTLTLPHDEPIVKALLRKHRVFPKLVERIEFLE